MSHLQDAHRVVMTHMTPVDLVAFVSISSFAASVADDAKECRCLANKPDVLHFLSVCFER